MTSETLKRIAVDSNVILSATIGKAALQIFTTSQLKLITTEFNFEEVEEYLPHLAIKYSLGSDILAWQLKMLPLTIYPKKYYASHYQRSQRLLKHIDPDDSHLLALALKENVPICSNDKDFKDITAVHIFTVAQLLKIIS